MADVKRGTYTNGLGYKDIRKPAQTYWSEIINGTANYDPPSMATMTGTTSAAIGVIGAALGDRVEVFPPVDVTGVMVQGFVSAADLVKINLFNFSASTIDLASGTWKVQVIKP